MYLGREYLDIKKWADALRDIDRISYARELAAIAWDIRGAFVEWTAEIGKPYGNSLRWWIHRLAEKNTMYSPLFLYFCYMELCRKLAADVGKGCNLLIVCEERALMKALYTNLRRRGFSVSVAGGWFRVTARASIREAAYFVGSWGKFVLETIRTHWSAWATRGDGIRTLNRCAAGDTGRAVVIRTWVGGEDTDTLMQSRSYHDRYFRILPNWLRSQGFRVLIQPWTHQVTRKKELFSLLRGSQFEMLIPEDDIRISDYVMGGAILLSSATIPRGKFFFRGHDVTALVRREKLSQARAARMVRYLTQRGIVKRWKRRALDLKLFIDTFENFGGEKASIAAIRSEFPTATTVAYQHTTIAPFMLKYATTRESFREGLFPDVIVSNGPFFGGKLVEQGFPADRVRVGPSLRYRTANPAWIPGDTWDGVSQAKCVVLLGIEIAAAVELLDKVVVGLGRAPYHVGVKVHPDYDRHSLLRAARIDELPPNMAWEEGTISDALRGASCAVSMAGAAVLECVALGVPCVIVRRETALDMNPLDWWQGTEAIPAELIVYDAFALPAAVEAGFSRARTPAWRTEVMRLLGGVFAEPTDHLMAAFVSDGRVPPGPRAKAERGSSRENSQPC